MGDRPLPPTVLANGASTAGLQPDVLHAVIRVISSSPDLDGVLAGVVSLLGEATDSHACFIYLREGDRLRLRAASPIYAHLAGVLEMGINEGLAGWAARTATSAFIREDAVADPRFHFVPELDEERFQSMVVVPLPARTGDPLGVVILHSEAPREFDEEVLTLLENTASLVSGAIENSQLLEQARRRVSALTALTSLANRISAATEVDTLSQAVSEGLRGMLHADDCFLHLLAHDGHSLNLAAVDPPDAESPWPGGDSTDLAGLLRAQERPVPIGDDRLVLSAAVAAGDETLGILSLTRGFGFSDDEVELVRAVASQAAVALKRTQLIERLTGETAVRQVLEALEAGDVGLAQARGRSVGLDLTGPFLALSAKLAPTDTRGWATIDRRIEQRLRSQAGAVVDIGPRELRGIVALSRRKTEDVLGELRSIAAEERVALGVSWGEPTRGGEVVREAADACLVAASLSTEGALRTYDGLGAYRFLIRLSDSDFPVERQAVAVAKLMAYDHARKAELLPTLEEYLHRRGALAATARSLIVHPNTLRQRLERIEQISGLSLADEDLLALELAIKATRLRGLDVPSAETT